MSEDGFIILLFTSLIENLKTCFMYVGSSVICGRETNKAIGRKSGDKMAKRHNT